MELGSFFQVPVNYFAVLLSGVASMIVGFVWYGPLFGKQWGKLVGFTPSKTLAAKKNMTQTNLMMFISSVVTAYVLFHFIWYAAPGSLTLFIALKTATWAGLGFIAPVSFSTFIYNPDKKPMSLLLIEVGYQLVSLLVMSVIFFLFR